MLVTTHTLSRDAAFYNGGEHGDFAPVIFYDGQGFLTYLAGNDEIDTIEKLAEILDTWSVCVRPDTTTWDNLIDLASENGITISLVPPDENSTIYDHYNAGDCEFATTDQSGLLSSMSSVFIPSSKVLPVTISKEPLAPMVRMGGESERFEDVVRWVVYATFFAEERGINKDNVKNLRGQRNSLNSEERRLLGLEGNLGVKLGLDNDWAYNVIKKVGNHEDIFQRNLGPLGLSPGLNQPPPDGLMFSPPFR